VARLEALRTQRARPHEIIHSGWDGAARRSSSGSLSPLRSPAACRRAVNDNRASRWPALNGHPELSRPPRELHSQGATQ
jgi:hypothetical protein